MLNTKQVQRRTYGKGWKPFYEPSRKTQHLVLWFHRIVAGSHPGSAIHILHTRTHTPHAVALEGCYYGSTMGPL